MGTTSGHPSPPRCTWLARWRENLEHAVHVRTIFKNETDRDKTTTPIGVALCRKGGTGGKNGGEGRGRQSVASVQGGKTVDGYLISDSANNRGCIGTCLPS